MELRVCKPFFRLHGHVQDAGGSFGRHCEGQLQRLITGNVGVLQTTQYQISASIRDGFNGKRCTVATHCSEQMVVTLEERLLDPDDICRQPLTHESSRISAPPCGLGGPSLPLLIPIGNVMLCLNVVPSAHCGDGR